MRSISKPFGALSETLELEWNQGKGEKELAKYNSNWIYWQGRGESLMLFADDFRWQFSKMNQRGKKLPFCCAHGCKCQMGVVDWEFDRHQHTFFLIIGVEIFRDFISYNPKPRTSKGTVIAISCCCICLGSPVSNLPGVDPSPIFVLPDLPYLPHTSHTSRNSNMINVFLVVLNVWGMNPSRRRSQHVPAESLVCQQGSRVQTALAAGCWSWPPKTSLHLGLDVEKGSCVEIVVSEPSFKAINSIGPEFSWIFRAAQGNSGTASPCLFACQMSSHSKSSSPLPPVPPLVTWQWLAPEHLQVLDSHGIWQTCLCVPAQKQLARPARAFQNPIMNMNHQFGMVNTIYGKNWGNYHHRPPISGKSGIVCWDTFSSSAQIDQGTVPCASALAPAGLRAYHIWYITIIYIYIYTTEIKWGYPIQLGYSYWYAMIVNHFSISHCSTTSVGPSPKFRQGICGSKIASYKVLAG